MFKSHNRLGLVIGLVFFVAFLCAPVSYNFYPSAALCAGSSGSTNPVCIGYLPSGFLDTGIATTTGVAPLPWILAKEASNRGDNAQISYSANGSGVIRNLVILFVAEAGLVFYAKRRKSSAKS